MSISLSYIYFVLLNYFELKMNILHNKLNNEEYYVF